MIFNCLSCCKAISSRNEQCPFCMIELSKAIAQHNISKETEPLPVRPKQEAGKRKPGSLVYNAVASISDIVQAMRSTGPKKHRSHS
jgi:hypothetical protein